MSTHAMPPLSLICNDFVKAFTKQLDDAADVLATEEERNHIKYNGARTMDVDDHDTDDDGDAVPQQETESENAKSNMEKRRILLQKSEQIEADSNETAANEWTSMETELKKIAEQLDFVVAN